MGEVYKARDTRLDRSVAVEVLTVMAASVQLQVEGAKAGRPELLFRAPNYGVLSRDGKRFLVLSPEGGEQPNLPMVVVQNWAAGLGK